MRKNEDYTMEKLPLDVICKATQGDSEAIDTVRTYYRPYLRAMAVEELYDATGESHYVVNEDIFQHLESKMMDSIAKFKLD